MSERDFAMALAMLAEGFGEKNLTPVRIEAYHRSLKDIPLPVLNHGVMLAIKTCKFFPRVAELREVCEAARLELRAALPYKPCPLCADTPSPGWLASVQGNVERVKRCRCWLDHQQQVEALGVGSKPLALPAGDFTQVGEAE